ncbi:MAG: hypothetical protein JNK02_03335 [Planctomycetes bacterium]|nr:hypothetical protein [Planctomycetota bacterium]
MPDRPEPVTASWRGALVCALLAGLVRLAIVLLPPADLLENGRVWTEELLRGNVAIEILRGPIVPLQDHAVGLWGGAVVVGILAAPLFALLGAVLPALRIACLPFPMIEAAAAFVLLGRLGGRRAAWAAGLLVAFAPPGPVLDSVLAQGTHQHFHALTLGWMAFAAEVRARRLGACAQAALTCALGLLLYFGGGLLIALAVALELGLDRAWWRSPRLAAARVAGLLLGLVPLVLLRPPSRDAPLGIYGHGPAGLAFGGGEEPLARLRELFVRDLPEAFWIRGDAGWALGAAWLATLLVLWVSALWLRRRERDPALLALVLYPPAFAAIWAMSPLVRGAEDLVFALRYVLPLLGVLALSAALAIADLGARAPRAGAAILLGLVLASTVSLATKLDLAAARETWRTPAARPQAIARIHLLRRGAEPQALERFLERVRERRTPEERTAILRDLDRAIETAARAYERLRERGEEGADPAPWRAALERVRQEPP